MQGHKANRAFVAHLSNLPRDWNFTNVAGRPGPHHGHPDQGRSHAAARVACVIGVFARKIVGKGVSRSMTTGFIFNVLHTAFFQMAPSEAGKPFYHCAPGSRYLSLRCTKCPAKAGIDTSVGTAGESRDSVLAESTTRMFKTRVTKTPEPWTSAGQVT